MLHSFRICITAALLIVLITANFSSAQNNIINFDLDQWVKTNAKIVEHLGRQSLMGFAYLKDVNFQNGVIEVDIATAAERSYPGVQFRIQNQRNYERVYIRPHRQHLYSDALQYLGTFNGIDSWQLYNGEGITSLIDIPANQWNHLKIVISGSQAKLYWNNSETPALEVYHLAHGISSGTIALNGPANGTAYFSNFSFTADDTIEFEPAPPVGEIIGAITDWELSQVFPANKISLEETPEQQGITDVKWEKVKSDVTGRVDISKHHTRQNRAGDCIFAKTIIDSDKDKLMETGFGYSDYITVFLNGRPLFFGGNAYRLRDPSFLGIVGYFDNLFLPLKKGANELMILVTETFGGWAFQFRDEDAVYIDENLTELWKTKRTIQIPESVVYDAARDVCYVTSYFNNGKECIARMDINGKVLTPEWIIGLNRPTGMIIHNDKLYTVDRKNFFEIDIDKGEIVNKYAIPDAGFPNDVAVDGDENFYISDSDKKSIYKFHNGSFETFFTGDEIANPNGLLIDDNRLLVGVSVQGCLKAIDLKTKEITTLGHFEKGAVMDGIKPDGNGNYLVSDFNGKLYSLTKEGGVKLLLNTTTPQFKLADFEYIADKQILIIPTLWDNKILSYKIK